MFISKVMSSTRVGNKSYLFRVEIIPLNIELATEL